MLALGVLAAGPLAAPAAAQVGHEPTRSPFRDLAYKQDFTLHTGYYVGSKGRAGVAPSGGPMLGVRYDGSSSYFRGPR